MLMRRALRSRRGAAVSRPIDALEAVPDIPEAEAIPGAQPVPPPAAAIPELPPAEAIPEAQPVPPPAEAIAEIPPPAAPSAPPPPYVPPPPPPFHASRSSARLQAVRRSSASLAAVRRSSVRNPAIRRSSASLPAVRKSSAGLPRISEEEEGGEKAAPKPSAPSKTPDWMQDKRVLIGAGAGGLVLLFLIIALVAGGGKDKTRYYRGHSSSNTHSRGGGGFVPNPKSTGKPPYESAADAARAYKSNPTPENLQKLHLLKKNLSMPELDRLQAEFGKLGH